MIRGCMFWGFSLQYLGLEGAEGGALGDLAVQGLFLTPSPQTLKPKPLNQKLQPERRHSESQIQI